MNLVRLHFVCAPWTKIGFEYLLQTTCSTDVHGQWCWVTCDIRFRIKQFDGSHFWSTWEETNLNWLIVLDSEDCLMRSMHEEVNKGITQGVMKTRFGAIFTNVLARCRRIYFSSVGHYIAKEIARAIQTLEIAVCRFLFRISKQNCNPYGSHATEFRRTLPPKMPKKPTEICCASFFAFNEAKYLCRGSVKDFG